MAMPATYRLTEEEYLAIEQAAEYKSEFYNGEMFAMAGGSPSHNQIAQNVGTTLNLQLRDSPCRVYNSDQRVKASASGLYTYPDVTVACGKREFAGATLLTPTVVVEVLSPDTEAYDRGAKSAMYRTIESLQEYVLVSQDHPHVERCLRQGEAWLLEESSDPAGRVTLPSIGCTLALADVYLKVDLPEQPPLRTPAAREET